MSNSTDRGSAADVQEKDVESAYRSLRVELAHIFGPVQPREGETWNAAMLRRITERLVEANV